MSEVDESAAVSACVICGHRAIWHHDEPGCLYPGNGAGRCPCRRNSDQVVARIIHDAIHRAGNLWADAIVTCDVCKARAGQPCVRYTDEFKDEGAPKGAPTPWPHRFGGRVYSPGKGVES